jgi:hypothetical protein
MTAFPRRYLGRIASRSPCDLKPLLQQGPCASVYKSVDATERALQPSLNGACCWLQ